MASPHDKLAQSLGVLKSVQAAGLRIIRAKDHPKLTRTHRSRLRANGFLGQVIAGWYMLANPADEPGGSTNWFTSMGSFVAAYADSRFGHDWQLAPEQSLILQSGYTGVIKHILVYAPRANNQPVVLPHGCSLFLYRIKAAGLRRDVRLTAEGLRVWPIEPALVASSAAFFARQPEVAQIALRRADITELVRECLHGGRSVVAGRVAGALRAVGREADAQRLLDTMKSVGHKVSASNPFEQPLPPIGGALNESPYVQRVRTMWPRMRERVKRVFDGIRVSKVDDVAKFVGQIEDRYLADAYHSLSIEGYQVTEDLIEKVRGGNWRPDLDAGDREVRNALAAKGYHALHTKVLAQIRGVLDKPGAQAAEHFAREFHRWYGLLFSPSVQAGIVNAADLAGYRNLPVYIRNAAHVPPPADAVRDCMPVLMELLMTEPHPGVRAVLGHFFFVFIHPYMDGNGRLARFIFNFMLCTGGYHWTIVTVDQRAAYMAALDQASTGGDIGPFADLMAGLVRDQRIKPIKRISQRQE